MKESRRARRTVALDEGLGGLKDDGGRRRTDARNVGRMKD
jgi:hypothetical protein